MPIVFQQISRRSLDRLFAQTQSVEVDCKCLSLLHVTYVDSRYSAGRYIKFDTVPTFHFKWMYRPVVRMLTICFPLVMGRVR